MRLTGAIALLVAGPLLATAARAAPTCSVEVHPRFNLYVVSVDGKPFKNKHYIDREDAALLSRVLVESGQCVAARKVATCGLDGNPPNRRRVQLASAGSARQSAAGADPAQLTWSSPGCGQP